MCWPFDLPTYMRNIHYYTALMTGLSGMGYRSHSCSSQYVSPDYTVARGVSTENLNACLSSQKAEILFSAFLPEGAACMLRSCGCAYTLTRKGPSQCFACLPKSSMKRWCKHNSLSSCREEHPACQQPVAISKRQHPKPNESISEIFSCLTCNSKQ